jgi:hypothetical protein
MNRWRASYLVGEAGRQEEHKMGCRNGKAAKNPVDDEILDLLEAKLEAELDLARALRARGATGIEIDLEAGVISYVAGPPAPRRLPVRRYRSLAKQLEERRRSSGA